jgi:sulfur-carrier protein
MRSRCATGSFPIFSERLFEKGEFEGLPPSKPLPTPDYGETIAFQTVSDPWGSLMQVTIRYFAGHRDITGKAEERLDLAPGTTLGELWEQLVGRYPRLGGYSGRLLQAINQEFASSASELHDGDEVAFIPPVSGGLMEN